MSDILGCLLYDLLWNTAEPDYIYPYGKNTDTVWIVDPLFKAQSAT